MVIIGPTLAAFLEVVYHVHVPVNQALLSFWMAQYWDSSDATLWLSAGLMYSISNVTMETTKDKTPARTNS